jgi:hypothetical protein
MWKETVVAYLKLLQQHSSCLYQGRPTFFETGPQSVIMGWLVGCMCKKPNKWYT